ncbi:MAG: hypothetical protein OXI96_04760 [Acidimicrobiaceae bacterium]|nr:hypothetical protein [Acidimicrobiaceae bacterium]
MKVIDSMPDPLFAEAEHLAQCRKLSLYQKLLMSQLCAQVPDLPFESVGHIKPGMQTDATTGFPICIAINPVGHGHTS